MKDDNPVNTLHRALAHAAYQGFGEFSYEDRDWEHYRKTKEDKRITKKRMHTEYELTVVAMFPQTWGSTALGFGGIGGQAITTAYTIVIRSCTTGAHCVYFGGQLAYYIEHPKDIFFQDMANQQMNAVAGAQARYGQSDTSSV